MAVSTEASVDITKKKKEKEAVGDGRTVEVAHNPEVSSVLSLEVARDMGNATPTLQVTTAKSVETREVSSERVVTFKTPSILEKSSDAARIVENLNLSEEVNDAPGDAVEDESGSAFHGDGDVKGDDDDDGDDDESEHPGEMSIKKKLWTFFTT